ncbi:DUF4332 domain-containing protein [Snodgrassella sp. B3882]|uniref:DUF4332 domain-containing protein n=1 Tax=Snodgrassella sp. B3882 TaxID=2818037 RepID=UPI00226AF500|nr:DUF4332 domain-containing protein [Snodgrassella sp. B3882]MCX8744452.1 DUF4332 domain-containing protein [Snodgrassella sp. B3882]
MVFSESERALLVKVKGVGDKVIDRLEQIGINSLAQLAEENPQDITQQIACLVGSSCWKNSPQAKMAISSAVEYAQQYQQEKSK